VTTQAGTFILSGWWRRFGAYLLDSIIVGIPSFIVALVVGVGSFGFETTGGLATHRTLGAGAQFALVLTAVVLTVGYPFLFLRSRGQTLGMMAAGIRAVDRIAGGPLTTPQTWRRVLAFTFLYTFWAEIASIIDFNSVTSTPSGWSALILVALAGLATTGLWPLNSPLKQTLQDKAADTIVIRTGP